MSTPASPPTPRTLTELSMPPELKELIRTAPMRTKPMSIAYVDEQGAPSLSFRASIQPFGDSQLALWVRDPNGGLVRAIGSNPQVALLYGDMNSPSAVVSMRGRARVDASEAVRSAVYGSAPEMERKADPDKRGVAVVVDLDGVHGRMPGYRFEMRRA